MKPIWLLDVDGVLNASFHRRGLLKDWVKGDDGKKYPLRYSPEVVAKVSELSERAEIHWCTSWGWKAPDVLAPLVGLPNFPVELKPVMGEDNPHVRLWWKYVVFRDYRWNNRKVIWTDDDIPTLLLREHKPDEDALVIRPHSHTGMTVHDLKKIEAWLDRQDGEQR